jgi:hypothetical protein
VYTRQRDKQLVDAGLIFRIIRPFAWLSYNYSLYTFIVYKPVTVFFLTVAVALKKVLCRLGRKHLLDPFSFLYFDPTAASVFVTAEILLIRLHFRGNGLIFMRFRVNAFNCLNRCLAMDVALIHIFRLLGSTSQ